ncbi:hypothetical protein SCUP234_12450 [Seiridium cupressi]
MDSFPFTGLEGYALRTFDYKSTRDGGIKVDVVFPEQTDGKPTPVLLHYHGGFLLVGDRRSFLPYWLVRACASRKWIFVSPDYRLIPESTALQSVEDAVGAYEWVLSALQTELGREIGPVLMAGSSAGGYLALATASSVQRKPSGLLLIYGVLDVTFSRYTTPGTNVFGRPVVDTKGTLAKYPKAADADDRPSVSAYPLPADPTTDDRFGLIAAVHIDALLIDYMTGIEGIGQAIAKEGPRAIPKKLRVLFPLSFGDLAKLPPTMLLHGRNDSAVPVELSLIAKEKLQAAGVEVSSELPDNAEHGFDAMAGNVDVETPEGESVTAFTSLRNAISFLSAALLVFPVAHTFAVQTGYLHRIESRVNITFRLSSFSTFTGDQIPIATDFLEADIFEAREFRTNVVAAAIEGQVQHVGQVIEQEELAVSEGERRAGCRRPAVTHSWADGMSEPSMLIVVVGVVSAVTEEADDLGGDILGNNCLNDNVITHLIRHFGITATNTSTNLLGAL